MAQGYPRRLGKYVLLKPLAKGGMGEIYLAAGGETGGFEKLCVIKKVLTEKADPQKANRFVDEAKVVLRLSHANLVTTFDAGDVDGEFYIAMELVEGKDLREVWNRCVRTRTRIPLDVALHIVREVARALAYVHSYGDLHLVHRDVAPPNILLSYFGEVKLTDFGLARSVLKQEQTAPGVVFGRAAYLAPEQARGEVADARTDVYTLGIVLWELLTGQQLLQLGGVDPATALTVVRQPKIVPPSSRAPWVGSQLDGVVLRALAVDRNLRFQSAEEMRKALAQVIGEIAPRADAERVAEFLRTLYGETIAEERAERERLLKHDLPQLKARRPSLGGVPAVVVEEPSDSAPTQVARPRSPVPPGPAPSATASQGVPRPMQAGVSSRRQTAHTSPGRQAAAAPPRPAAAPVRASGGGAAAVAPTPAAGSNTSFVGRVVDGRYQIVRVLGEGGMGTVYAGEHVEIGKPVAVKILHPVYSGQQDLVERFRREARAASRIGHPNIIDVTDFGTTEDGCAYFVMEQLEGIDLADVLAHERRLDPSRAVQICIQICRALQAAHSAGIIHRDLKPENVFLVARDGTADFVKVLDFGIARTVANDSRKLTNPGIAMGTPEYMAPEQAQGRPADARTDIYAVGAMLYEMVTGVPPHSGSSFLDILSKKNSETPRPPREKRPEVSEDLERVILSVLDKDPDRRPQTMAQLEYALTKSLRGRGEAVAALLGIHETGTPPPRTVPRAPAPMGMMARPPSGPRRHTTREAVDKVLAELTVEPGQPSSMVEIDAAPSGGARHLGETTPLPILIAEPPLQRNDRPYVDMADAAAMEAPTRPHAQRYSGDSGDGAPPPEPVGGSPAVGRRSYKLLGAAAVLAAATAIAVIAYNRLPWVRGERPGQKIALPAPARSESPGEARARRLRPLLDEAQKALNEGRLVPPLPDNLKEIIDKIDDQGGPDEAERVRATAVHKLKTTADEMLGRGSHDVAIDKLKSAMAIDPGAPEVQDKLAAALLKGGRQDLKDGHPDEALSHARDAVALPKAGAEARLMLADALLATKDYGAAVDEYGRLAVERPGDPAVKRGLARARKLARPR